MRGSIKIPNFWMRVSPEQTVIVQYWLFNQGAKWVTDTMSFPKSDRNPIIIHNNGKVTYASDISYSSKLERDPEMIEFTYDHWVKNYNIDIYRSEIAAKVESFEGFELGDEVFIVDSGGSLGSKRSPLAHEGEVRVIKSFKPAYWLTTYIYKHYVTFDNDACYAFQDKETIHKYLVKNNVRTIENLISSRWYVATFLDGSMLIFRSCGESVAFTSGVYTSSDKALNTEVAGHVFTFADILVKSFRHATSTEILWATLRIKNGRAATIPESLVKPEDGPEVMAKDLLKTWDGLTTKNHLGAVFNPSATSTLTPSGLYSDEEAQPEILRLYVATPRVFTKTGFVPLVINSFKQFKI